MYVAEQREQITVVVDEGGVVAALKEVPHSIVTTVKPLRVARLQCVHDRPDSDRASSDRKMDVVSHQAIREKLESESLAVVGQTAEVLTAIGVVEEHVAALVASRNDMVEAPAGFES